jgi:endonuclease/exonuclease/phosphatase family metal-dependent hydrolase
MKRAGKLTIGILLFIQSVFILGLLFSIVAPYISPQIFVLPALCTLAFPFWLIANIFFVVFWSFVRRRFLIPSVIVLLLTIFPIRHYYAFGDVQSGNKMKDSIKVLDYNARSFDLYNWTHDDKTREKMFSFIENKDPDIAGFQEFYSSGQRNFSNIKYLRGKPGLKNYFFHVSASRDKDRWGIALFTKFPIVDTGVVQFQEPTENACIYADIKMQNQVIRVFCVHLQSVQLNTMDYKYLDSLANREPDVKSTKNILSKLIHAYKVRSLQAETVHDAIAESPYPVIVCSDFNDMPISYAYHTISDSLQDAFLTAGYGIGATYNGFIFPIYRIDYILASKEFQIQNFTCDHVKYSDHYPISATLSLK